MSVFVCPSDAHVIPESASVHNSEIGFERWNEIAVSCRDQSPDISDTMTHMVSEPRTRKLLAAIFGNSPYLSQSALKEPASVVAVAQRGATEAFSQVCDDVHNACFDETDRNKVMKALRVFKRRAALIIAMADISEALPLEELVHMISMTAEKAAQLAVRHLLRPHFKDIDSPEDKVGYFLLAMGKLGAQELNYSSDVDFIALYDAEKAMALGLEDPRKTFIQVTRDFVTLFDSRTADGYVFRTDLRLRPDPGSTPIAISTYAAELYYESFGQNWERAAMIKARPIAGDIDAGNEFLKTLRPFVWRKSLDYNSIQDIHSIKRQINSRRGGQLMEVPGHNVKLGRGGIREIEFYAQTQQLIWGGREPLLRNNQTLKILRVLSEGGYIKDHVRQEMHESYIYLRRVEHRLQMIDDEQTQTLPKDPDKLKHLAIFLGYDDVDAFGAELLMHLRRVENNYSGLFPDEADLGTEEGNLVFTGSEDDPETLETIRNLGYQQPEYVCQAVKAWHAGRYRSTRSTRARQLLNDLVPVFLKEFSGSANPDEAFRQFDNFLSHLPTGVQLFAMFQNHPQLMKELIELLSDSPRLAQLMGRHPHLLDNLLSPEFMQPLPETVELVSDLQLRYQQAVDFEDALNIARRFVKDRIFQIGVQTLRRSINAKEAGLAYSHLADAVLQSLMPLILDEFCQSYGQMPGGQLVIMALGRLGAESMTPTSDLDLILIYDTPPDAMSDGKRELMPSTYYARIVQRFVNALTAPTADGILYEADMRLRPSGNAGPLAVSFEAFEKYQTHDAWTWEHQALTRARVVAGDADLKGKVEKVIHQTLSAQRDSDKLVIDVADMRERVRQTHGGESEWDAKHRRGGLLDQDFISQYLQLRYAHEDPNILSRSFVRVVRRAAEKGILAQDDVENMIEARKFFRTQQMLLRLTMDEAAFRQAMPKGLEEKLCRALGVVDMEHLRTHMETVSRNSARVYVEVIEAAASEARARLAQAESAKC